MLWRAVSCEGGSLYRAIYNECKGPEKCSGLPVQRYDAAALAVELGHGFDLLKSIPETHVTPWGKPQAFQYAFFRRHRDSADSRCALAQDAHP